MPSSLKAINLSQKKEEKDKEDREDKENKEIKKKKEDKRDKERREKRESIEQLKEKDEIEREEKEEQKDKEQEREKELVDIKPLFKISSLLKRDANSVSFVSKKLKQMKDMSLSLQSKSSLEFRNASLLPLPDVEEYICKDNSMPSGLFKLTNSKLLKECKTRILEMWQLNPKSPYFPGPQPVSLMRSDIPKLLRRHYYVTEKTRGVRFLLAAIHLQGKETICLVNRRWEVFIVGGIELPVKNYPTLLDGELVQETVGDKIWKFLVFDMVHASGVKDPKRMPFRSRIELYKRMVSERFSYPCDQTQINNDNININNNNDIQIQNSNNTSSFLVPSFRIFAKNQYPWRKLKYVIQNVIPFLPHATEGLILTPDNLPIKTGKHKLLFKLKQGEDHTMDLMAKYEPNDPQKRFAHLQWQVQEKNHNGTIITNKGNWPTVAKQTLKELFPYGSIPENWNNCVLECNWDELKQLYQCVWNDITQQYLIRNDKDHPNTEFTIKQTKLNIVENITFDELTKLPMYPVATEEQTCTSSAAGIQKNHEIQQVYQNSLDEVQRLDTDWYYKRIIERTENNITPSFLYQTLQELQKKNKLENENLLNQKQEDNRIATMVANFQNYIDLQTQELLSHSILKEIKQKEEKKIYKKEQNKQKEKNEEQTEEETRIKKLQRYMSFKLLKSNKTATEPSSRRP